MNKTLVSIIIPTYNRAGSVRQVLHSLTQQTVPSDCFEVIVVDDGSTDSTPTVAQESFPFALWILRQTNQGATAARNTGARQSSAEVLFFLDDDIDLAPTTLENLIRTLDARRHIIVLGRLQPSIPSPASVFARIRAVEGHVAQSDQVLVDDFHPVPFTACMTGVLAVRREDFFALGMFQDPTGGWPNWDDVDFGYRAHQSGYQLLRCPKALGYHRDHALADLKANCHRWERAARSAVRLFEKYPDLQPCIPMFHDKTPISLRHDPLRLLLRKVGRAVTAWRPVLWGMEQLVHLLERVAPRPGLLQPLYRWTTSSYIHRGYRQGIRECSPARGQR